MGTWSYICKGGCGKPICEGEDVVGISSAVYEGYGRVGDDEGERAIYHRACFDGLVAGRVDFEPGEHDPNQGCDYPDPRFVPEGTVLYETALDAVKGRRKVGVLVDVSGASPVWDAGDGLWDATAMMEQAFHYLGVEEVELITFDHQVRAQGAVPAQRLRGALREKAWLTGGGGNDPAVAFAAAAAAGCDAVVLVSDGLHPSWPEAGPPTVHVRLFDAERDERELPGSPDWLEGTVLSPYYAPLTDDERDAIEARVSAEMDAE